MAFINFKPSDYFATKTYTANGSTNAITGVGFQPNFTWIKKRSATSAHYFFDSLRTTYSVSSNTTGLQADQSGQGFTSLDSDGFTLSGTGGGGGVNDGTNTFASWNWKAGTTSGLSGGTITPSAYSINTTSGVGIYKYSGNSTSGATIAHGLGVAPTMLITKKISATGDWHVAHKDNSAYPWNSYLYLNTNNGTQEQNTASWFLNNTAPSSTLITLGNGTGINSSGVDYIIYAFAPVKGYSAFGKYTATGTATGPLCVTNFRPAFVMVKRTDSTGAWYMYDNKRAGYNGVSGYLQADSISAEDVASASNFGFDFFANGFKIKGVYATVNAASGDFIYAAFAENPIVGNNGTAGLAR